jgi:tetratricopeptide (TPR) repeat protein
MPIDPRAATGGAGDFEPTIAPFTADRTPDPGITTSPGDDTAPTIAPGSLDAELTIAPSSGQGEQETLLAGTKLGTRYTVLKLLGRGGMGAVYQAYDDELGVAVAIKTILPGHGSDAYTRRDQVSRFKSELLLARQVTHKNVVRIHDLGEFNGLKYITMSYVAGETLAGLIRRVGPLPVPQAMSLARQIADGMAAAHEVGVVHRDLKPDNVMVTPDGQALIMDFGIASSSQAASASGTGIVGTIAYMAPEQATGKPADARADIYAYGLILCDMLLGRHRLGQFTSPIEEMRARFESGPPSVRTVRGEVPPELDMLITKATRSAPDERFADAHALRELLSALTDDGTLRPVESPRARWPVAAASMILTAIVAIGGWWWLAPTIPVTHDPVSVLIADFENRTGDPVFDGVVEQALGFGIESASFVTAYPRRDALRVAATIKPGGRLDESTARLVALREGVSLVLLGAVEPDGAGYRITARALQGGDEQAPDLYTLTAAADGKNAVLDAVGRLAGDVRKKLGDTEVPRGSPTANETFTAASLEAARAYAGAQELQWAGNVEAAIDQYREAIKLDPEMGRAYSGLAAQYANLARPADAETNYGEAMARIDRMTDREKLRTRGSYYLFARKPDLAAQEFTALVKAFPADTTGLSNLALAAFYQRDMAQALEQGRRAAAIFPKNVLRRSNVALYAMYAGSFEDAIAEAAAVHELNPTHAKAFISQALSLLALGRSSEALTAYDQLGGTGAAGASFAAAGRADLAHYEGRLADAATLLKAGIAADLENHNEAGATSKRLALAEARLAQGDYSAAAREAEASSRESDADVVRASAGLVLAAAGRGPQAEAMAGALGNKLEADPQAYGRLILGELALARNEPRKAVEYAREAQKLADTWLGHVILGRAYLGLNAFPEAYAEFDTALKRKGEAAAVFLDDMPSYRHLPPIYYFMGLAQTGLKSRAAIDSFKSYLDIKSHGDESGFLEDARRRTGG